MITYCTFPCSESKNPELMDSHTVRKPKIPAVNVSATESEVLERQVQLKVVQLKYEVSGLLFFLVILFLLSAYATVPL